MYWGIVCWFGIDVYGYLGIVEFGIIVDRMIEVNYVRIYSTEYLDCVFIKFCV